MGLTDQAASAQRDTGEPRVTRVPDVAPDNRGTGEQTRVNWLFSGVMLGAASWLVVLGVVFAAFGNWVVAGSLVGGACPAVLLVWLAGRRARAAASARR
jgi:hypothetical protein